MMLFYINLEYQELDRSLFLLVEDIKKNGNNPINILVFLKKQNGVKDGISFHKTTIKSTEPSKSRASEYVYLFMSNIDGVRFLNYADEEKKFIII